jgi:hypothetical protein
MKKLIGVLTVLSVLAAARTSARANEAAPPPDKPSPPAAVPLVIVLDDSAKQPRLEIPRKVLSSLKASADGQEGDGRRVEALPVLHTIVAGVALSLAFTLGGLWLVRSRRRFTGTGAALLLAALTLTVAGGVLWANVPAPPPPRPADPGIPLADKATVQVVDQGDAIRLVASPKQLAGVMDKLRGDRDKQPSEKPAEKKENEAK